MQEIRKATDSRQYTMRAQIEAARTNKPVYDPTIDVFVAGNVTNTEELKVPNGEGFFYQLCSWFETLFK